MIPVGTRHGGAFNLGITYSDKWCNIVALYNRVVHVVAGGEQGGTGDTSCTIQRGSPGDTIHLVVG
jgi:hypothetical protein